MRLCWCSFVDLSDSYIIHYYYSLINYELSIHDPQTSISIDGLKQVVCLKGAVGKM